MADIIFARLCLNFLDVNNRNNVLHCISGRRRWKFSKLLAVWVSYCWSLLAWSSPAGLPIPLSLLYCGKCCLPVRQLVYENTLAQQATLLVLGYWTALLLCPEWVSENPKHLLQSSKLSRSNKLEAVSSTFGNHFFFTVTTYLFYNSYQNRPSCPVMFFHALGQGLGFACLSEVWAPVTCTLVRIQ